MCKTEQQKNKDLRIESVCKNKMVSEGKILSETRGVITGVTVDEDQC